MAEAIDKKYLEGLVFKSSKAKKGDNGTVHTPTERPLTPADVLDWRDNGKELVIVAADGQKYRVAKDAKKVKE